MEMKLPISLYLKHRIIGMPFEKPIRKLGWVLGAYQRYKHPELWEIYLEDYRLSLILQKVLRQDSCCVDVGCHIGSFISAALALAPGGHHYGFEPSRVKAMWLKKKFHDKVQIFQEVVGDSSGTCTFNEDLLMPGYSSVTIRSERPHDSYEVVTSRLDDVLEGKRVDLIKVDVEGEELAVLRGARSILHSLHPKVIFECTNAHLHRVELFGELQSIGYSIYTFGDFLFQRGPIELAEFKRCAIYPFRAFNFIATAD